MGIYHYECRHLPETLHLGSRPGHWEELELVRDLRLERYWLKYKAGQIPGIPIKMYVLRMHYYASCNDGLERRWCSFADARAVMLDVGS